MREMTELYLIAHKVRGEPAFDIAIKMEMEDGEEWWIIPTSGHRAYPYWSQPMSKIIPDCPSMPASTPDHYEASPAPKGQGKISNLAKLLGLIRDEPIRRRI